MKQNALYLFSVCLLARLIAAASSEAQLWSGVLSPERAIDWSSAGVMGGVPNRTTLCATLGAGASAAQINAAIQSCPADQVVKLNAGTYQLNTGIVMKSGVVLRGAGADQTLLVFSGVNGCAGAWSTICFLGGSASDWSGDSSTQPGGSKAANWTDGYAKGATQITLSGIGSTGIRVGQYLYLDQNNDTVTTGGLFQCEEKGASPPCSNEGGKGNPGRVVGGVARQQLQVVRVTACNPSCTNGATFTISPGLYAPNWEGRKNPGAFWSVQTIENAGLEDLSVDATNSGGLQNVSFFNAVNSWVRGTRQIRACQCSRSIIQMSQSTHLTIQDNYFYGTSGQSTNYGVESYVLSDTLVMNNIFQHVVSPMMLHSNTGSVYGYNYAINDTYDDGRLPQYHWMAGAFGLHSSGVLYNLFEGNVGPGLGADWIHGNQVMNTALRNLFLGSDPGRIDNTIAVRIDSWNRYFNLVGNVLGTPGYSSTYEGGAGSIYALGSGNGGAIPSDPLVPATTLRWGNFDVVTAGAYPNGRFLAAEVPSGLSQYANPIPQTHSLVPSFFLPGRPAWWPATKPFAPIGPDVSGGNLAGYNGHAYTVPAQDCYRNVMGGPADGSGAVLSFNRTRCYASGSSDLVPPAAPEHLRTY